MEADLDGTVRVVREAARFDWSWVEGDLSAFCSSMGWRIDDMDENGATISTNLAIARPIGFAQLDNNSVPGLMDPGQVLSSIIVVLSEVVEGQGEEDWFGGTTDIFAELSVRLAIEIGRPPSQREPGRNSEIRWDLPDVALILVAHENFLVLRIVNPTYQSGMDLATRYEDAGSYESISSDILNSDWGTFAQALALTLSRIPIGGRLVLLGSGGRYLGFEVESDRRRAREGRGLISIRSEIPRNSEMGADYHIAGDARTLLIQRGWKEPSKRRGSNWQRDVDWPPRYVDYSAAADAAVSALQDSLKFMYPTELRLEASGNWSEVAEDTDYLIRGES